MTTNTFLGSRKLGQALSDLSITCLDIGAREGITGDLLPLAPAVVAYGFEPDKEECERLNQAAAMDSSPWRRLTFLPVALGSGGMRTLHLYRARGGSSLLEANVELARQYAREDNFHLDAAVPLETVPLDKAAGEFQFADASYLKLDIQGSELEVLQSGPRLLKDSVVALRIEAEFLPMYHDQPLFGDVDAHLRASGFITMGMFEARYWRQATRRSFSFEKGTLPYSRGRLAHADFIYLKEPSLLSEETPEGLQTLLKAAFLALCYHCVDHAAALLTRPAVARHLQDRYGLEVEKELASVSRTLARRHLRRQCVAAGRALADVLLNGGGTLVGRPPQLLAPWTHR